MLLIFELHYISLYLAFLVAETRDDRFEHLEMKVMNAQNNELQESRPLFRLSDTPLRKERRTNRRDRALIKSYVYACGWTNLDWFMSRHSRCYCPVSGLARCSLYRPILQVMHHLASPGPFSRYTALRPAEKKQRGLKGLRTHQ